MMKLHLTTATDPDSWGPGRLYSIMAWPPRWLDYHGAIEPLRPPGALLRAYKDATLSLTEYRVQYERLLEGVDLRPGQLIATFERSRLWVADGDTLFCTCSRKVAKGGGCHRVWAAPFLARAGWRVILDGVELRTEKE